MDRLGPATRDRTADSPAQFVRFLLVGSANTALSYGIYALGIALGLPYQFASLVALMIGIAVGFAAHGLIVFRQQLRGRLWLFLGLWLLLYFANIVLIGGLNLAGLNYYLAGLVAAVPATLFSFFLQRHIVFVEAIPATRNLLVGWMIAMLAAAKVDIALRHELNWDEFLNLSMVYSHRWGELSEILQTAFVHVLWWIPSVSANEVDQLLAARLLMLLFVAVSSLAIYGIARAFADAGEALIAVLAFNGFTFVMLHGAALRTDTMATTAMLVAMWLAVAHRPGVGNSLGIGVISGLAGAFTIKAIFYLPTLGVVLLLRMFDASDRRRSAGLLLLSAVAGIGSFLGIVALHAMTFPDNRSPFDFVARTSGATMFSGDFSIIVQYLPYLFGLNAGFWLLAIGGIVGAWRLCQNRTSRLHGLALLSFGLPMLTLAFYRDTYPYFLSFIVAPVAVLAGYGASRITPLLKGFSLVMLSASAIGTYIQALSQGNAHQRAVLAQIHRLFPQPVPYIDHTSMVSSYPKQGIFMSRWGVTDYRRQGAPIMQKIVAEQRPRFLLVTRNLLDVETMDPVASQKARYGLIGEDVRVLQENYLRYWGPIYLPGKRIIGTGFLTLHIPGRYRLESEAPVEFSSQVIRPGTEIYLTPGNYRFRATEPAALRWAAPPAPSAAPPERLFDGF